MIKEGKNHAHEGVPHKGHEHHKHKKLISRRWQWATVGGNALLGVAEVLTGHTSTLSVTADGLHNLGDAATYGIQTQDIMNGKLTQEKIYKRRKIAHWVISTSSAAVAVRAAIGITAVTSLNPFAMYLAGASLLYNSLLFGILYKNARHKVKKDGVTSHGGHDLIKHFLAIDIPSAALAVFGVFAQSVGLNTLESIAAITSGGIGAWAFRPTEKNLNHNHGPSNSEEHTHPVSRRKVKQLTV